MVMLLVSLALGEDSQISQLAAGARFEPPAQNSGSQWVDAPDIGNADADAAATYETGLADTPDPYIAAAEPDPAQPPIEWQAPRVELLYVD